MKDRPKETSEAHQISEKKPSLKRYREEADRLTEARQISGQTLQERVKRFKNGETTLSEADAKTVLDALAKGAKISLEGTISLVGDPRRWGGMSGEGPSTPYESSNDSSDHENESRKKQRYEDSRHHDGAGSSGDLSENDKLQLQLQRLSGELSTMYRRHSNELEEWEDTLEPLREKGIVGRHNLEESNMIKSHRGQIKGNANLESAYENCIQEMQNVSDSDGGNNSDSDGGNNSDSDGGNNSDSESQ